MFQTKKSKIKKYLNERQAEMTPFDDLLTDYLSGELTNRLSELGIQRISFYIDWHADYKCINIQGRHQQNYVDIQVEPSFFSMGCDPEEPDEHVEFTLESHEAFYKIVAKQLFNDRDREILTIPFEQLRTLFSFDTEESLCLEIEFLLNGNPDFDCCCMGKKYCKDAVGDIYWFGLTPDGINAYEYTSFEDFSNEPVFNGKSLLEIWDEVQILTIDGDNPCRRFDELINALRPRK